MYVTLELFLNTYSVHIALGAAVFCSKELVPVHLLSFCLLPHIMFALVQVTILNTIQKRILEVRIYGLHVPLAKYCVAIVAAFSSSHLWSSLASFSQEASGSVLTQYSPSTQLFSLSVDDCCLILRNLKRGISRPKNPPTFFQSLTSPITSLTFSTVRVESEREAWGETVRSRAKFETHSRPSVTLVYF